MAHLAGAQKAARAEALVAAKDALRGAGAVEAGHGGARVRTASAGAKRSRSTVRLAHHRLRRLRLRA